MKRKTKQQRDAVAKAELRQRVADIATGAAGSAFDTDDEFATAGFLSRFIPALRTQFGIDGEGKEIGRWSFLWDLHNLHYFDTVDTTTDFLFEHDVRA